MEHPEPIGQTPCVQCRGTGKAEDDLPCAACQGTGLVPVFQQTTISSAPPAESSKQRRFSRYHTDLPITVRDQGERESVGRCVIIAEGGLAAIFPGPIPAGSVVTAWLSIPNHPAILEPMAVVRNQIGLRHGLEFVSLTDSERTAIRQFCAGLMAQPERPVDSRGHATAENR